MGRGVDARDTSADARRHQIAIWRSMSPTDKLQLVDDLCRDVDRLARLGIREDHPDASEAEVLWHLAARRYGQALANAAFGPLPTR